MGLLARRRPYDRRRNLERAALAARGRSKRKRRRAIALYREVLERDPSATDVHRKLAPLLARNGEGEAAARSYHTAADAYVKRGFVEQAIGVYREALVQLPRQVRFWSELAKLELERGRTADALKVLLEGRRVFRRRRDRAHAIALLLGLSLIIPALLIAAWRNRPPILADAPALDADDPSWERWNPWLAREEEERDPSEENR